MDPARLWSDDSLRQHEFPVTRDRIFMAHAAVTALPRAAADAMREYLDHGTGDSQENPWSNAQIREARDAAARLIGASPEEIALIGPTTLGLNLVAAGLPWEPGDEVVYYADDYPANVYPWMGLQARGVRPVPLRVLHPGRIQWKHLEPLLTPKTRIVALASCHFTSGYRIDIDAIGRRLHERGILFCLDAIQSLGAFPLSVAHVDFLSADSHKWLLGPSGAGIFYVKRDHWITLAPTHLGALNVVSPEYIAQPEIRFHPGARRYEPGTLFVPGIAGMRASIQLLLEVGVETVAARILELRRHFLEAVRPMGYRLYLEDVDLDPDTTDAERSGIVSLVHPDRDLKAVGLRLREAGVRLSLRHDRTGQPVLRFSPHFYNTPDEIDRVAALLH
jgi:cysteine desulfurase/selenocysteine lyase